MLGEILNRDVTVWEFFGATFEIFKVSKNLGATVRDLRVWSAYFADNVY